MRTIYDIRELENLINDEEACLVYFSNDSCNVCKVIKPKVIEMGQMQFPQMKLIYVDIDKSPLISGQYRVFTIPTILIYFQGKEYARFSRNFNMFDFEKSIARPYEMIFGE